MTRSYLVGVRGAGRELHFQALELLHAELGGDAELRTSFLSEAASARELEHPQLLATSSLVSDADESGRTTPWLDGQLLSHLLERVGRAQFPLRLQLWIHCQMLSGLHYARELGLRCGAPDRFLHGALGPESVLITYDGQVRVLGVGLSGTRALLEQRLGKLLMEPCYAAPERYIGGKPAASADVYAAGAMLWEAITRMHRGLASSVVDVSRPRRGDDTPDVGELCPDASERLAQICRQALRLEPAERHPDAGAMCTELTEFLADTANGTEPEPGPAALAELICRHFGNERAALASCIEQYRSALPSEPPAPEADGAAAGALALFGLEPEPTQTVTSFEADAAQAPAAESRAPESAPPEARAPDSTPPEPGAPAAASLAALAPQPTAPPPATPTFRGRSGTHLRPLALTQALDPEVIKAAWRRRQERRGQARARWQPGPAGSRPLGHQLRHASGTLLGVAGILALFAVALYAARRDRAPRRSQALVERSEPASPSRGDSRPGPSEAPAPSVRSALLPAPPPAVAPREPELPAPASAAPPPLDARRNGKADEEQSRRTAPALAPDAGASRTGASEPPRRGARSAAHAPVYIRSEDLEQLREPEEAPAAGAARPASPPRRAPRWRLRFEQILRSAAPAGSSPPPPRRIDESDPYAP